ncbi:MAG: cell division protein ZipA C-terminal FtsZ-binding domain-containing protein [Pseudomonadota bacterium]
MSNQYLIFIGLALVLFLAIVAYSVWQQRRVEKPDKKEYVDPLFAELEGQKSKKQAASNNKKGRATASKRAPGMGAQSSSADVQKAAPSANNTASVNQAKQAAARRKPQPGSGSEKATPRAPSMSAPKPTASGGAPKIDSASSIVTELVARVKNPEAIEQQELLSLFRQHDFKFHRKVHIYGLNQLTDLWRDIEFELPSARFVELGVAIQLADREGAMSQKELHDFQQMTLDFSNKFDAPFEFSMDIDEALSQAQILDQIARRYDSMAVLNVVPRAKTGFRMADIESCARDLLMSTDKNGIFVKTKGQKNNISVLYRLACTDGSGHFGISSGAMTPVHDLVIYMNVPAVEQPDRIFQDMVKDANNLATWLDGKVVDRNGKVMTQRSYSILMQQISDIAYSMEQDGLIPGDAVSKKLF